MTRMNTLFPTRKVMAGTLAAALTTLIIYGLETGFGLQIPVTVSGAITTVLTFLTAYFIPPSEIDQIVRSTKVAGQ